MQKSLVLKLVSLVLFLLFDPTCSLNSVILPSKLNEERKHQREVMEMDASGVVKLTKKTSTRSTQDVKPADAAKISFMEMDASGVHTLVQKNPELAKEDEVDAEDNFVHGKSDREAQNEMEVENKAALEERLFREEDKHIHALLYAMPLVLANLSSYSLLITTPDSMRPSMPHTFGNVERVKTLLLQNVHGFSTLMQHAGEIACPRRHAHTINGCLSAAMCRLQSWIDNQEVPIEDDLKRYALFEEMYTRFSDITWPLVTSRLSLEAEHFDDSDDYMTPEQHACSGTSAWHSDSGAGFFETAADEIAASKRTAAYGTSMLLVDAVKTTHAVLDAHTQNSSTNATLQALYHAWEPVCILLKCDGTNYRDLWRASHAHSLSLLEVGASALHMQVHIRTRQKLELRMQRFLGEYGSNFLEKIHRDEESAFHSTPKQYFSQNRGAFMRFATQYPKTQGANTLDYPLRLFDSQRMESFFGARGELDLLALLRSDGGSVHMESDADGVSSALVDYEMQGDKPAGDPTSRKSKTGHVKKEVSQRAKKIKAAGYAYYTRFSKELQSVVKTHPKRFKVIGNDMENVAIQYAKAVDTVIHYISTTFQCSGVFSDGVSIGYGKKFPSPTSTWGAGLSIGLAARGPMTPLMNLLEGNLHTSLPIALSVVFGAIPGGPDAGGLRTGLGISGALSCETNGSCNFRIGIGATGSALIPTPVKPGATTSNCFGAPSVPIGSQVFKCFYAYPVVLTTVCCEFDFNTGTFSDDCNGR